MLVATGIDGRIPASLAERGASYFCPNPDCRQPLTLKSGRKVVAHFAHRPGALCRYSAGETEAHLNAKEAFVVALRTRGLVAEYEKVVNALPGDRRADVLVEAPDGERIAIELQHSNISLLEIEERSASYARAKIVQAWLPFIRAKTINTAQTLAGGVLSIDRYRPKLFELWISGLYKDQCFWYYCPDNKSLYVAQFEKCQSYVPEREWFDAEGNVQWSGGYWKDLPSHRVLLLQGPFSIEKVRIARRSREAAKCDLFSWTQCRIALLRVAREEFNGERTT